MRFPKPENMSDLTISLKSCIDDLHGVRITLQNGSIAGAVELIQEAHAFADSEGAAGQAAAAEAALSRSAEALFIAEVDMRRTANAVRDAIHAFEEAAAKLKAKQAAGARLRG